MKGPHLTFFPQFCPEPINDKAWYPGFNDWDLIKKLPMPMSNRFRPAAGLYDLSSPGDIAAQFQSLAASRWPSMALYQYFFDGRFALDAVERFILSSDCPVPRFFTIWANESWSKRWVGKPHEMIIRQQHSLDEQTVTAHVERQCRLFAHPSYQHWNARPVFVIYSVYDVPNLPALLNTYRQAFASRGFNPLIGFCVPYVDPEFVADGFDFCVEFQPRLFFNVMRSRSSPAVTKTGLALKRWLPWLYDALISVRDRRRRDRMTPREAFVYSDYLALLEQDTFHQLLKQAYGLPVLRCLFYSWNNFPRYRGGAVVVTHGEGDYERFLRVSDAWQQSQEWYLVNSWNEWSEGAALEPGVQPPQSFDLR